MEKRIVGFEEFYVDESDEKWEDNLYVNVYDQIVAKKTFPIYPGRKINILMPIDYKFSEKEYLRVIVNSDFLSSHSNLDIYPKNYILEKNNDTFKMTIASSLNFVHPEEIMFQVVDKNGNSIFNYDSGYEPRCGERIYIDSSRSDMWPLISPEILKRFDFDKNVESWKMFSPITLGIKETKNLTFNMVEDEEFKMWKLMNWKFNIAPIRLIREEGYHLYQTPGLELIKKDEPIADILLCKKRGIK